MLSRILPLLTLIAWAFPAADAFGQTVQQDAITRIDGVNQETDVFFNASHCADPTTIDYILTLGNFNGVTEAFLWVGGANDNCEKSENRNDNIPPICAPLADSQSRVLEDNGNIPNLPLQELLDTGVVDCENGATTGEKYELFAFRNAAPGTNEVPVEGYGVAAFTVDVVAPLQLNITNDPPELEGTSFTVTWGSLSDDENIPLYRLYRGNSENPDDVDKETGLVASTGQGSNSITATASGLDLALGESTYLFVSAVDNAATNVGDGNEGPLSAPVLVTSAATLAFCDDPNVDCSGCSASPMVLTNGRPASGLWMMGLVMAIVVGWRFRR